MNAITRHADFAEKFAGADHCSADLAEWIAAERDVTARRAVPDLPEEVDDALYDEQIGLRDRILRHPAERPADRAAKAAWLKERFVGTDQIFDMREMLRLLESFVEMPLKAGCLGGVMAA